MQDSEDIIEYDNMINNDNKILTSSGEVHL